MGLYDSGVGGLSVLKELRRQIPGTDVIYLADTARIPFGGKTPAEIIQINREILPFLISKGAKFIMMACGTSSALAYPVVKDDYSVTILELIGPGTRAAMAASKSGRIGLFATEATVKSGAYQSKIKVFATGCPLFVPLIEAGRLDSKETIDVVKGYLQPLLEKGIDTLILGCTHYPHLRKVIDDVSEHQLSIIDPAEAAIAEVTKMIKSPSGQGETEYYVTADPEHFKELGTRLLGQPISDVKQVSLV